MGHMINDYLWRQYMPRKHGLIFVVDSANLDQLEEAQSLVKSWHNDRAPKGLPFLIYANMQDLPDALSVLELIGRLGLKDLHGRPWHIKVNSPSESSLLSECLIPRFSPPGRECCYRDGPSRWARMVANHDSISQP